MSNVDQKCIFELGWTGPDSVCPRPTPCNGELRKVAEEMDTKDPVYSCEAHLNYILDDIFTCASKVV